MADTDGPVCLTSTAPNPAFEGHLLIYDVVSPALVSRSGVLSSILDSSGPGDSRVRLPDVISLSEFKTWSSTITDKHSTASSDFARACTVLKVADALDDRCFNQWLKNTVAMFREAAVANHTSGAPGLPDDISAALSSLPYHLQQRLIEDAIAPERDFKDLKLEQSELVAWLDMLPSQHHASVVQQMTSPGGILTSPKGAQSLPFLTALSQLPPSPTPLLHLNLRDTLRYTARKHLPFPQTSPVPQRAAALAAALRHHPSLTSLHLDTLCGRALQTLVPAIATLTALQLLHLGGGHEDGIAHATLPRLSDALRALPSLQELFLCIGGPGHVRGPQKRPREDAATTSGEDGTPDDDAIELPLPQVCIGSVLAGVTALTSLDIDESWGPDLFTTACRPLTLPRLRQLTIDSMHYDFASTLICVLTAPLSVLTVSSRNGCGNGCTPEQLTLAQQLWARLPTLLHLRSLDIEVGVTCGTFEMEPAMIAAAPAAIAALPCLEELRVAAEFPVLQDVVQRLAGRAGGAQLRRLALGYAAGPWRPQLPTSETWGALMAAIRALPLQCLRFDAMTPSAGRVFGGLAALQPLTQLTALRLYGWGSCLGEVEDLEALADMLQLRILCINDLQLPNDEEHQEACVRTLGALPALTELELHAWPGAAGSHYHIDELEAAFLEHAPWAEWPALQQLSLASRPDAQPVEVAHAVAEFPAIQRLTLDLKVPGFEPIEGHDSAAVRELRRIASEAAFELVLRRLGCGPPAWESDCI